MPIHAHSDRSAAITAHTARFWRFIIIPFLWLAGWTLSGYFALAWIVALGIYILLVSLMAIMNLPNNENRSRLPALVPNLFKSTGPIVWGGFLALLYWMAYLLIFHFEDLNAR